LKFAEKGRTDTDTMTIEKNTKATKCKAESYGQKNISGEPDENKGKTAGNITEKAKKRLDL